MILLKHKEENPQQDMFAKQKTQDSSLKDFQK